MKQLIYECVNAIYVSVELMCFIVYVFSNTSVSLNEIYAYTEPMFSETCNIPDVYINFVRLSSVDQMLTIVDSFEWCEYFVSIQLGVLKDCH